MTSTEGDAAAPPSSIRLIFEYEGNDVRLVAQQPVDVAVTGFDLSRTNRPGHYVETRDDAGAALARVPVHEAFTESTEVFPEDPSEPITRVDAPAQGAFTVVVPASPAAQRVAVVRLEPAPGIAAVLGAPLESVQTVDLASFELRS
jgi:hypothetical protein